MNIQTLDFSVDLLQSLLWQHNNAHRLTALIRQKQEWYAANQDEFWSNWVKDVFDLRTANQFGLKVWSIILDMPINIVSAPVPRVDNLFGFGSFRKNFGNATFGQLGSGNINVLLEDARSALQIRYFSLICRPTIPQVNRFLHWLLTPRGIQAYLVDKLDMTYNYVFTGAPSSGLLEILLRYDVLPRPAAVGVYVDVPPLPPRRLTWGFGSTNANFNHGSFYQ